MRQQGLFQGDRGQGRPQPPHSLGELGAGTDAGRLRSQRTGRKREQERVQSPRARLEAAPLLSLWRHAGLGGRFIQMSESQATALPLQNGGFAEAVAVIVKGASLTDTHLSPRTDSHTQLEQIVINPN